jgi:intermediate filament protein if
VQGKSDMESWYKLKVTEVKNQQNRQSADGNFQRDEVTRLRTTISDTRDKLNGLESTNTQLESQVKELHHQLESDIRQYEQSLNERDSVLRKMRDECQLLVSELQNLLETKQMLDTEIAIYRKMLEGEESRTQMKDMVSEAVKTHALQQQEEQDTSRQSRAEKSTRTTFQRSAKGNIAIADCDVDGKFIVLENTHRSKEEDIGEWKLKRSLDNNKKQFNYTFPDKLVIKPGETVKIWARVPEAKNDPPREVVFDGETSWGQATGAVTTLVNKDQEERATFTQRTVNVK